MPRSSHTHSFVGSPRHPIPPGLHDFAGSVPASLPGWGPQRHQEQWGQQIRGPQVVVVVVATRTSLRVTGVIWCLKL